ncbi:hypothetical protein FUAX_18450 [Fulvitalea axinellae]|uniref:Uncharacterized protein n=1 Tax=Fulvitalea axinellae TaxID=1182444 RepID=A0AAU9D0C9_9BACT|nr:hypothetical protein FUAX_18450 [Fulvitalea axinellae]
MAKKDRATLKKCFEKGSIPNAEDFADLIDSCSNLIDDDEKETIGMTNGLGWTFRPQFGERSIASFFSDPVSSKHLWQLDSHPAVDGEGHDAILFRKAGGQASLSLHHDRVGVNHISPRFSFEVEGTSASSARVGTSCISHEVPADKKWHTVTPELSGCRAFEIIAQAGSLTSSKIVLSRAIALNPANISRARIRRHSVRFNFWSFLWIQYRWTGSDESYALQMRTNRKLGLGVSIRFHITELWNDDLLADV